MKRWSWLLLVVLVLVACARAAPTQPLPPAVAMATATDAIPTEVSEAPATLAPEPSPSAVPSAIPQLEAPTAQPEVGNPLMALFQQEVGVNLAGAEFGEVFPGVMGDDYVYPSCVDISRWTQRGVKLIRYPFRLERVVDQGVLRKGDVQELAKALDCAANQGAYLVLDMHNEFHVRISGQEVQIGAQEYPVESWIEAWLLLVKRFTGHPGLAGYGLMGEPRDLQPGVWPQAAQAVINRIRELDTTTPVLIGGDGWSSADEWLQYNRNLDLVKDPANLAIYEVHLFLDPDGSGDYSECQTPESCRVTDGTAKLVEVVNWCEQQGVACWVGSFGVPTTEPAWEPIVRQALDYLQAHNIGAAFWGAGPWWEDYLLSLEFPRSEWLVALISSY